MASKNDDFFDGMFDFDGDGKTDLAEQFLEYKIFEEVMKEDDPDSDDPDETGFLSGFTSKETASFRLPAQATNPPPSEQPVPEHISLSDYKSRRRAFIKELFISILIAAVLCVFPGGVIWAAASTYDANVAASGFVAMIFAIAGFVAAGAILYFAASHILRNYIQLRNAREIYLKDAPEEELDRQKRTKKKRAVWFYSVLGAGLMLMIVLSAVASSSVAATYGNAENLIAEGQYAQAAVELESIRGKNYKDTAGLLLLCKARTQYAAGRSIDAYYTMQDARFRHQTEEQDAKIASFKAKLEQEYDDYISRLAERSQQEYESGRINGVPYVGMPESRIYNTSLGRPSDKVRHSYRVKDGKQYPANLYDFYQNGKCVFTVQCIQGTVTEVWDNRYDSQSHNVPGGSAGKTYDTGPEIDGFSAPEDFYDWYRDDFIDYEEAEDYYYSHGGE